MASKRKSPSDGSTKKSYDIPWVEKYRPRSLEDVVGNEETLVRLRAIGEDGNMPNLILCGPPGTGKLSFDSELMMLIKSHEILCCISDNHSRVLVKYGSDLEHLIMLLYHMLHVIVFLHLKRLTMISLLH